MTKSASRQGVPQISLSHFLLTGHLVTNSRASRALALVEEAKLATRAKRMVNNRELKQIEDSIAKERTKKVESREKRSKNHNVKDEQSGKDISKTQDLTQAEEPKKEEKLAIEEPKKEDPVEEKTKKNASDMTEELFPFMGIEEELKAEETRMEEPKKDAFDMTDELFPFTGMEEELKVAEKQVSSKTPSQAPTKKDENKYKESAKETKSGTTFTKEQDAIIMEMKARGKSWTEMCKPVKAGKKQIQERYKELSITESKNSIDKDVASTPSSSEDIPATTQEKPAQPDTNNKPEDKAVRPSIATQTSFTFATTVSELPPLIRLKADGNWTDQDCEILEMLEKRYREQKWLHMQSQFYNYTGRMVPADIIKWKFGAYQ